MKEVVRAGTAYFTMGLSEAGNAATDLLSPDKTNDVDPVSITQDQEDKAAIDESEAEARRRRRGMLRRVFTTPGANFVNQSNIGRNTLTGE